MDKKLRFFLDKQGGDTLNVANADFSNANMIFEVDSKYNTPYVLYWSHDNQYIVVRYYLCPIGSAPGCSGGAPTTEIVKADGGGIVSLRSAPEANIKDFCGWAPDNKFVYILKDDNGLEYLALVDLSQLDSPESSVRISYIGLGCPFWLP